jgi:hypothetical protein
MPTNSEDVKYAYTRASMALNSEGVLLPYTCQAWSQQVDEYCQAHILAWNAHKARGARIVQVEVLSLENPDGTYRAPAPEIIADLRAQLAQAQARAEKAEAKLRREDQVVEASLVQSKTT